MPLQQSRPKRKQKLSKILLGIDEVGRGPWAGPLVIGAVILKDREALWTKELTDSKKLSPKKRTELNTLILKHAATGLGWVSVAELDQCGLGPALKLAARRAIEPIIKGSAKFDEIIIDGTINFLTDTPYADKVTVLPKADLLVKEVSAASIIAKVARDNYMIDLAKTYPNYGFEQHVGYGTIQHRLALSQYGICPEHRKSFRPIQEIMSGITPDSLKSVETKTTSAASKAKSPTATGQQAENIVANYLQGKGHTIISHNFKTKTYEIDLISIQDNHIYFTEVKYRKTNRQGSPFQFVTPTKQKRMRYAAKKFLADHPVFQTYQPHLAVAGVEGLDFKILDWFTIDE